MAEVWTDLLAHLSVGGYLAIAMQGVKYVSIFLSQTDAIGRIAFLRLLDAPEWYSKLRARLYHLIQ